MPIPRRSDWRYEALGLTAMAGAMIKNARAGRNIEHGMEGLFRQSVCARLAGYEDVDDHERLLRDPAMRAIIGKVVPECSVDSSQAVSRFETEALAAEENVGALSSINHAWEEKAMRVANTMASGVRMRKTKYRSMIEH